MLLDLEPPQSRALELLKWGTTLCLAWGRGTGKSWFLWHVALLLVAKFDGVRHGPQRGIRIIFLVDTLKHFRDIYDPGFIGELDCDDPGAPDRSWKFLGGVVNRSTLEIRFPGGSIIKPFPAAEHTSKSALGKRCDVMLLDEADNIDLSVYESVALPWFSERWSYRLTLVGGTPRRGRHGLLYKLYLRGQSDKPEFAHHHSVHATYRECPRIVSQEYVEQQRLTMTPSTFKREWECDFDSGEGQVYDIFDPAFHVRALPASARLSDVVVGVDWGWENPGVFLVIGIVGHGSDAQAYVMHEDVAPKLTVGQWAEKARTIKQLYPDARWYADPSQPANIATLASEVGIAIEGANNKILQGVACVADKLFIRGDVVDEQDHRWSRLYIDPSCAHTLNEITTYRRKPLRGESDRYGEEIEDKNNHAMDALRYALVGRFGFPSSERVAWTTQEWG
jgi:hypothetical protein